jgi:hypothetical protein
MRARMVIRASMVIVASGSEYVPCPECRYSFLSSNVAFSCRRACGRLGICLCLFPLNDSPLASVIGQLQRLVIPFFGRSVTQTRTYG